ncbi:unnamed protein product, partial [Polarella glacialis]
PRQMPRVLRVVGKNDPEMHKTASADAALELLGFTCWQEVTADELRRAFRRRAREQHPDVRGGSSESFRALRDAYALLRRESGSAGATGRAGPAGSDGSSAEIAAWRRWEQDVQQGLELPLEGEVIFWRPEGQAGAEWRPSLVLALQVNCMGPHPEGFIYMQRLVPEPSYHHTLWTCDPEDNEMQQIEPLGSDGLVHWRPALKAELMGDGRWRLGPEARPYLPR